VPIKRDIDREECLFSNRKMKQMLGFKPVHDWRKEKPT